jgi:hypothetical protein
MDFDRVFRVKFPPIFVLLSFEQFFLYNFFCFKMTKLEDNFHASGDSEAYKLKFGSPMCCPEI